MENYKKSRLQIDGIPTLEYLRKHHSKPPTVREQAEPASPEYLPSLSEEAEAEVMEVDRRYVPKAYCPIHEDCQMTCLNADEVYGALLFKCTKPGCSVFYTSLTAEDVCYQLREAIHPSVWQRLLHADLKCHCDFTPRMKLSQSQKNPGRVFLTCFKTVNPCNYFQWVHWKIRQPQGPMDAFVQKQPRAYPYQKQPRAYPYQKPERRQYTRPNRCCPPDIQNVLTEKASQQLVRIGLDRFKKDDVKMYPLPPSPWDRKPWENDPPQGFVPSPGYKSDFRNGLYIGSHPFGRSSSVFTGVKNF